MINFVEQDWRGSDKDWVKPITYHIESDGVVIGCLYERYDGLPKFWFELDGRRYSGEIIYPSLGNSMFDQVIKSYRDAQSAVTRTTSQEHDHANS